MDIKRGYVLVAITFALIILSGNFAVAAWTEELNDNLVAYYNFNQSGGLDSVNGYSLAEYNIDYTQGIQGNSAHFDDHTNLDGSSGNPISDQISFFNRSGSYLDFNASDFSFNLWLNHFSNKTFILLTSDSSSPSFGCSNQGGHVGGNFYFYNGWFFLSEIDCKEYTNEWVMLTITKNSSSLCIWANGNLNSDNCYSLENDQFLINGPVTMGGLFSPTYQGLYDGLLDELGIWNRSLTQSEVSQLYNNGNGITYTNDFNPPAIPPNQSGFWTLNGTNLYPSNLSYKVGIGTNIPSTALEVIGTILASDDVCIIGGACLSDISGINFANFALVNSVNTFLENQIFDNGIVVNGDTNISGNLYLNGKDVYASLPQIIKVVENISTSSTTLTDITGLNFNVTAGKYYHFRFLVPFRSSITGTGLKLSLSVPSYAMFSATAHIPRAADGPGAEAQGWITSSDDAVTGSGVQAANTDYLAVIEGVIKPSADGVVQARFASETTNTVTIREGSIEYLYQI